MLRRLLIAFAFVALAVAFGISSASATRYFTGTTSLTLSDGTNSETVYVYCHDDPDVPHSLSCQGSHVPFS